MALLGACFGVASILGPLVGGAFTDHVNWRFCFWVNVRPLVLLPNTFPLSDVACSSPWAPLLWPGS